MQDLLCEPNVSIAWYNGEEARRSTHKFVSSEQAVKSLPCGGINET